MYIDGDREMTKNSAINLAIKALRRFARDYYGWEAKFHPDKRAEYDKYMQAIKLLEGLKDE